MQLKELGRTGLLVLSGGERDGLFLGYKCTGTLLRQNIMQPISEEETIKEKGLIRHYMLSNISIKLEVKG